VRVPLSGDMIISGGGLELAHWLITIAQEQPGGQASNPNNTPAIVALITAFAAGTATIFSVFRQNRNDKAASQAIHSDAANKASDQSFRQLREVANDLRAENRDLKKENKEKDDQIDDLEREARVKDSRIRRLERQVSELGGKL
jgi:uncharacterized protein HemX